MIDATMSKARVVPAPVADFGLSPTHPTTADEIRLYDFSYDPGGVGISSRSWDFGDGDASAKASPRHRFDTEGRTRSG